MRAYHRWLTQQRLVKVELRLGGGVGDQQSAEGVVGRAIIFLPFEHLGQVAEGVKTAKSARNLAKREGVEMPITAEVYAMLYEEKPVPDALRDLLGRERKAERG